MSAFFSLLTRVWYNHASHVRFISIPHQSWIRVIAVIYENHQNEERIQRRPEWIQLAESQKNRNRVSVEPASLPLCLYPCVWWNQSPAVSASDESIPDVSTVSSWSEGQITAAGLPMMHWELTGGQFTLQKHLEIVHIWAIFLLLLSWQRLLCVCVLQTAVTHISLHDVSPSVFTSGARGTCVSAASCWFLSELRTRLIV